ncbi:hypothetical protein OA104_01785 [Candidatus Pelagibacter sp.]|nr:hypothetical protein [Candidatus Pelagibacter sp.]
MILFKGRLTINNKKWRQQLGTWTLYYRTEIVYSVAGFIVGLIVGLII